MKMRGALFTTAVFVATSAVITNAWVQKQQFYPTVVYLTKSSPSLAVLYLQALLLVFLFGKLMVKLFFGQLRSAEMEHLVERSWYAVTDTCLAFTMFRDDLNPMFLAFFTFLLFLKSFHWLLEDRVAYMERTPIITLLFKLRVITLVSLLLLLDVFFVYFSYLSTISKGPSVQLVFGFEYSVLAVAVISIFSKYILHLVDLQSENPWENKAVYMLYVEVVTGFLRVIFYLIFTFLMLKVHTFPLFCIRPMYLTMRQFKKAFYDILLSRRAIQNMNTLYPDATFEELEATDNTCIICREEMRAPSEDDPQERNLYGVNKKLPCGHIFHASCLRSWFQRQQTCPTCRLDVLLQTHSQDQSQQNANQPPEAQQQQQAQQPPQQQLPIPPPNPFAAFYPPPMFGNPMAPPTGAPPAANATGASPEAPQSEFTPPPPFPMMPPPPMMTPFFPPPPPMMPQDFSGMSDEQVRAMEGSERKAVEARVECLRNIQLLLDAAMHNIHQYMSVSQNSHGFASFNLPTMPSSSQPPTSTVPTTSVSTTSVSNTKVPGQESEDPQPSTSTLSCTISGPEVTEEPTSTSSDVEVKTEHPVKEEEEDEMMRMRRRRLEKLTASTEVE